MNIASYIIYFPRLKFPCQFCYNIPFTANSLCDSYYFSRSLKWSIAYLQKKQKKIKLKFSMGTVSLYNHCNRSYSVKYLWSYTGQGNIVLTLRPQLRFLKR